MESRYKVALKKTDEGYSVWVPGLPGCVSQGNTEAEALDNIRDAIREYLSVVDELAKDEEKREVVLNI
jgi:predicted RNase H-like HicB family nuclease